MSLTPVCLKVIGTQLVLRDVNLARYLLYLSTVPSFGCLQVEEAK